MSSAKPTRSNLSLLLVPFLVTLLVSVLRTVGEMQGWNDMLFSNVTPGEDPKPGLVGIVYLAPIFGFWFGLRLRRDSGQPATLGKAAVRWLIGSAVLVGGLALCFATGLVTLPKEGDPGSPNAMIYMLAILGGAAVVMFTAWPRLAWTLLLYGFGARIPVVVITWLALEYDWGTHHTKLPKDTVLPDGTSEFMFLAMPQLTFWIVVTMMLGGLAGCLGAAIAKPKG